MYVHVRMYVPISYACMQVGGCSTAGLQGMGINGTASHASADNSL